MSNENEQLNQPSEEALALFMQDNDLDQLTDILVSALSEALRIMEDDIAFHTFH